MLIKLQNNQSNKYKKTNNTSVCGQQSANKNKRTKATTFTRKWQVRWQNKYVALKINFQHNRIQANIIDSFPASQIKYYLRRAKLDTHGHIARKRLHLARESYFVLTKILEDLKTQLGQSTSDDIRPVAAPILGRVFFRGWNIRLKLRKVIRHIKATYKYTKQTTFSQVAYRTFSRMFSPRKGRRRNRRKKLRSLRRIRYIRQKQLWKIKAIRKFNKRYVSAACTVRPVLTTYLGLTEHFLHQKLALPTAKLEFNFGQGFRQVMRVQLRHLHQKGFFTQLHDWKQSMHYRKIYALVKHNVLTPNKLRWLKTQQYTQYTSKLIRHRGKKLRRSTRKQNKFNEPKVKDRSATKVSNAPCFWLLHCAVQQQCTGRYAKRLHTLSWRGVLQELSR